MKTRLTWHSSRVFSDQHAGPYRIIDESIYLIYAEGEYFLIPRSFVTEEFYQMVFSEYKERLFRAELSAILEGDEDET